MPRRNDEVVEAGAQVAPRLIPDLAMLAVAPALRLVVLRGLRLRGPADLRLLELRDVVGRGVASPSR